MKPAPMLSDALVARARARSSATLHEAAKKIGALPASIKPLSGSLPLCGRVYPATSPSGDNLWLHHAIYAASPGDVLVVDVGANPEFGYWGEVMAVAAMARGLAGLVINGGVRDVERMVALKFPVFSSRVCIRGTGKNVRGAGTLGLPLMLGDVPIVLGDLVFGDADGVVVLPAGDAAAIVEDGERRDAEEEDIFRRLRAGETTLHIYGLPTPHALETAR